MNAARCAVLLAPWALLMSCSSLTPDLKPGAQLRDCEVCPQMVVIPPGRFTMGSNRIVPVVPGQRTELVANERPVHAVTIPEPIAFGKYEVTRREYAAFVADAGYTDTGGCLRFGDRKSITPVAEINWENPGIEQGDDEPVMCTSWLDAQAYAAWLTRKTGHLYRLPSEAEWEYAARAGTALEVPWGDSPAAACEYANLRADANWKPSVPPNPRESAPFPCNDGHRNSARVGSYKPNAFGLYDMIGNVAEWTLDCNHPSYAGAPVDGSPWFDNSSCVFRVLRGGSYLNSPNYNTRATTRMDRPLSGRAPSLGFRVVRSLADPAATSGKPAGTADLNPVEVAGASQEDIKLFRAHCGACHVDGRSFPGLYGRDQVAIERVIRDGVPSSTSMPGWKSILEDAQIKALATYVRKSAGWN